MFSCLRIKRGLCEHTFTRVAAHFEQPARSVELATGREGRCCGMLERFRTVAGRVAKGVPDDKAYRRTNPVTAPIPAVEQIGARKAWMGRDAVDPKLSSHASPLQFYGERCLSQL